MIGGFKFQGLEGRSRAAMRRSIYLIGESAREFFKGQFHQEGFTDVTYKRWQKRRRSYRHKILTKTGNLRDSIKSNVNQSSLTARVFTTVEYSEIHNEGGTGRLPSGQSFEMPKRQFIGDSQKLDKGVEMILEDQLDKLFI